MKKLFVIILLLFSLMSLAGRDRKVAVVFPFEGDSIAIITDTFIKELDGINFYKIIDKKELIKTIKSRGFESSELSESEMLDIGYIFNADLIFTGSVKEKNSEYIISVKCIESKTKLVKFMDYTVANSIDDIAPKIRELVDFIAESKSFGINNRADIDVTKLQNSWVTKTFGISPADRKMMLKYYSGFMISGGVFFSASMISLTFFISYLAAGATIYLNSNYYYGDSAVYSDAYSNNYYGDSTYRENQRFINGLFIVAGVSGGISLISDVISAVLFATAYRINKTYMETTGDKLKVRLESVSLNYDKNSGISLAAVLTF